MINFVKQEHIVENRLNLILEILKSAQQYLKDELTKTGLLSMGQIDSIINEGYLPEKDNILFRDDGVQL